MFAPPSTLGQYFKVEFDFGDPGPKEKGQGESLGSCPKCQSPVLTTTTHYQCESPKCHFRVSKVLLQKTLPLEQVKKLLRDHKTEFIEGFISNKTKRPFKAMLITDKTGEVKFTFN